MELLLHATLYTEQTHPSIYNIKIPAQQLQTDEILNLRAGHEAPHPITL
jgi:hypothetical protein